jgi:inner membrane protein
MIFFGHIGITIAFVFIVFYFFKGNVDYRFVIVGSILPDIIDKPLGQIIFYSVFQNGRIISHTLFFVAVLTLIGIYVERRYRSTAVEFLALGALIHLVLDQMWNTPQTLFWPLLGWAFPTVDLENYSGFIVNELTTRPDVYLPEILGFLIVVAFTIYFQLYKPTNLKNFIKNGTIISKQSGSIIINKIKNESIK